MFFCEVESHMQKLSSFGQGEKIRPKTSLKLFLQVPQFTWILLDLHHRLWQLLPRQSTLEEIPAILRHPEDQSRLLRRTSLHPRHCY